MNFYSLQTTFAKTPKTIQCYELNWDRYVQLIYGNYNGISFPLKFIESGGRDWVDIICPSVGFHVVSERFITALEENKFTGWKACDVVIFDKNKQPIKEKYYGLSVIGKSGPIDYTKSKVEERIYKATGKHYKCYIGQYFDLNSWDKSDFFLTENNLRTVVTEKVFEVLNKCKYKNLVLKSLETETRDESALTKK